MGFLPNYLTTDITVGQSEESRMITGMPDCLIWKLCANNSLQVSIDVELILIRLTSFIHIPSQIKHSHFTKYHLNLKINTSCYIAYTHRRPSHFRISVITSILDQALIGLHLNQLLQTTINHQGHFQNYTHDYYSESHSR